jgi:hypothetical protein
MNFRVWSDCDRHRPGVLIGATSVFGAPDALDPHLARPVRQVRDLGLLRARLLFIR